MWGAQRPEEGTEFPGVGVGVAGGGQSPSMGTGMQIVVLQEHHTLLTRAFSQARATRSIMILFVSLKINK